jgi:hypothetical protein
MDYDDMVRVYGKAAAEMGPDGARPQERPAARPAETERPNPYAGLSPYSALRRGKQ